MTKIIKPKESPFVTEALKEAARTDDEDDNATATESHLKKILEEAQAQRTKDDGSHQSVGSPVPMQVTFVGGR